MRRFLHYIKNYNNILAQKCHIAFIIAIMIIINIIIIRRKGGKFGKRFFNRLIVYILLENVVLKKKFN